MSHAHHSESLLNTSSIAQLTDARIAIIYTEWNDKIIAAQLEGCHKILMQHNATIVISASVPGCFELPFACHELYKKTKDKPLLEQPEAIIAFGAVIRGGTPHFEYVSKAVTDGITQLNISLPIPIVFGVLTLDTEAQAWERLGGTHGHKGEEAALTALKMIQFCRNK